MSVVFARQARTGVQSHSGPEDSLNTLLVPANLTDDSHDNDGTFHGGVFIRHVDHYVTAFVDNAGALEGKRDHSSFAATYYV